MISPTPGRVLWYYPHSSDTFATVPSKLCAALVAFVHSDHMVNVSILDVNGNWHPRTSVALVQEGEKPPAGGYLTWMPYQLGQAKEASAKTPAPPAK